MGGWVLVSLVVVVVVVVVVVEGQDRGAKGSLGHCFCLIPSFTSTRSCTCTHTNQVAHALDATQQKGQELADAVESALTGKK